MIGDGKTAFAGGLPPRAGGAYAFAVLAPRMMSTIGFNDASYAQYVSRSSPVAAAAGDASDQFVAPNGQLVTVTVKSPVTTQTYYAPPIAQGQDPLAYFQQQFAAAGTGETLVVPRATYNFAPIDCTTKSDPGYHGQHMVIEQLHDFVLDGQGSTLNFVSDCPGIVLDNVTRVVFKNFTIDWPGLKTAAVGSVVAVNSTGPDEYTYNLQVPVADIVDGGFNIATAWDGVNNYWSLPNATEDFFTPQATPYVFSPSGLATNVSSFGVQLTVGQTLLVRNIGVNSAITVWNSHDVTMNNVTINAAPNTGYLIEYGRGFHMIGCTVTRSNGRPISTTADAVHFNSYGGDVIIENSTFAYQGDDALNLHTGMQPISALPSCPSATSNCPFQLPSSFGAQTGDTIALFGTWSRLWGTEPAVCAGANCTVNAAPIASVGGYAADLSLADARYVIQNNTFSHNRARGLLLQTPYGLVQNNVFVGQTGTPLFLETSDYWEEGAGAQNVLFLNNQVSSPGVGNSLAAVTLAFQNASGAVVYNSTPASGGKPHYPGTQQNIVFADNSFSNLPGAAFYISSANNVVLSKNTLTNTNTYISSNTPNINAPIVIYDSSNVLLSRTVSDWAGSLFLSDATDGAISVQ